MFRRDGVALDTVCSHGELGLPKRGYVRNADLFAWDSDLLSSARLKGEMYDHVLRKFQWEYLSDTFKGIRRFVREANRLNESSAPIQLLIHPHRWRFHKHHTLREVQRDALQAAQNFVLGRRRYDVAH